MIGKRLFIGLIFIFFVVVGVTTFALSADIPKMTIDELKSMLGNSDLVIVDVRLGRDLADSDLKIKGAAREDPNAVESWVNKYPKEKTVVAYCA